MSSLDERLYVFSFFPVVSSQASLGRFSPMSEQFCGQNNGTEAIRSAPQSCLPWLQGRRSDSSCPHIEYTPENLCRARCCQSMCECVWRARHRKVAATGRCKPRPSMFLSVRAFAAFRTVPASIPVHHRAMTSSHGCGPHELGRPV